MNKNQSDPTPSASDVSKFNESIQNAVGTHRRRMQWLTGAAFLFGFITIAASVLIVSAYFVLYRPKQMQLLRDVTVAAQAAEAAPAPAPGGNPPRRKLDFSSVQATMTHALSFGTMLVAGAVGFLAIGTLVMLALVVLQRRATLDQINVSLARISNQLKELQTQEGNR